MKHIGHVLVYTPGIVWVLEGDDIWGRSFFSLNMLQKLDSVGPVDNRPSTD